MINNRLELYKQLEEKRKSKVLVFVTSDRPNMDAMIAPDILPYITHHLDRMGDQEKISLYLYTRGGQTTAAWSLVNLLRSFCNELEIIVPFHCHSAGTLICLGANNIVMTRQATLGPIDPSTNGFMNPQIQLNNLPFKVPVSVEAVYGYLEMARKDLGITDQESLTKIYLSLSEKIHPLTLGEVFKTKSQIQMLARTLLAYQNTNVEQQNKIIRFLCSESGSHDYTIHRKEAKEVLGLNIEYPDAGLYSIINSIYLNIEHDLLLNTPYNPAQLMVNTDQYPYSYKRCLIESIDYGTNAFISEGVLTKQLQAPGQPPAVHDSRKFEGWRYEGILY